jgi:hypothetical protein
LRIIKIRELIREFLFKIGLLIESLISLLKPAITAINWPVCRWLKRKFGYFFSAFRTFPISLDHLTGLRVSAPVSTVIASSIFHNNTFALNKATF